MHGREFGSRLCPLCFLLLARKTCVRANEQGFSWDVRTLEKPHLSGFVSTGNVLSFLYPKLEYHWHAQLQRRNRPSVETNVSALRTASSMSEHAWEHMPASARPSEIYRLKATANLTPDKHYP